MDFKIDAEFEAILPPLAEQELATLEKSLGEDGCMTPLIVWKEKNILVDGHNRFKLCEKLNIEFSVKEKSFDDRDDAMRWIVSTQLARRNLSPDQMSIYRGMHHEFVKKASHRPNKGVKLTPLSEKTPERLAKIYGVSPETIKRDSRVARAVNAIGDASDSAKDKIMAGKVKVTKTELMRLANAPPEEVAEVAKQIDDDRYTKEKPKPVEAPALTPVKDNAYYDSIRQRANDLKNPDIDRSYSFSDYMLLLENHARSFSTGLEGLGPANYPAIFASMTKAQMNKVRKICDSMAHDISAFVIFLRGETDEEKNEEPVLDKPDGA